MDKKTFSNPDFADYINQNFHAIKFDAEWDAPIKFGGKTYEVKKQKNGRQLHELALKLMDGKASFPSVIILNEQLEKESTIRGFKDASTLKGLLTPSTQAGI